MKYVDIGKFVCTGKIVRMGETESSVEIVYFGNTENFANLDYQNLKFEN